MIAEPRKTFGETEHDRDKIRLENLRQENTALRERVRVLEKELWFASNKVICAATSMFLDIVVVDEDGEPPYEVMTEPQKDFHAAFVEYRDTYGHPKAALSTGEPEEEKEKDASQESD